MPTKQTCLDDAAVKRIVKLEMKIHEEDGVLQQHGINEMGFQLDDEDAPMFADWYGNSAPIRYVLDVVRGDDNKHILFGDLGDDDKRVAKYKAAMVSAMDDINSSGGVGRKRLKEMIDTIMKECALYRYQDSGQLTFRILSFVNGLHLGKLSRDTTLYSGFRFNPHDGMNLKVGSTFETKYPLCTTVNPLIAIDYAFNRDVYIEDGDALEKTESTNMFLDILNKATKSSIKKKVDTLLPVKQPIKNLGWVLCFRMKSGQSALCSDATQFADDWLKEMEYTLPIGKKYKVVKIDEAKHIIELELAE